MRKYIPLIWFGVVAIAWLGPTLIGRVIFAHDADLAIYYYPVFNFFSNALHSGQSFLWIPGIFSGFPIYLSQSGGFLDPINILIFSLFSNLTGMHVRLALDIFLTVGVSFLASRSLGLSRTASLLVGPCYLLSIHLRAFSNPIVANTLFLLPLLIYTTHEVLRGLRSPVRLGVIAGIGLGWALLSGYTQLVVYALILTALFAIGHLLWRRKEWHIHIRRLAVYGAITLILGTLLGLPFILPAQKFLPLSARAIQAPLELATLKSVDPGDLLLTLVPDYMYFPYITSGRKSLYVGALWFLLALGGFVVSLQVFRRRETLTEMHKGSLVSGATALFALVAAFKWSPIFMAMTYLPVVGLFRFPFRFMFLGAFFFALLGGYGFDMMREVVRNHLWRSVVVVISGVTACFLLFIVALHMGGNTFIAMIADGANYVLKVTVYGHMGFTKDPIAYQRALENGLNAYREFFTLADIGVVVGMSALVFSCALFIAMVKEWVTFEKGRYVSIGLVALTCLVLPASQWVRFVLPEHAGMRPQAISGYVGSDSSLYRVYSFLPGAGSIYAIPPQYKLDSQEEAAKYEVLITGGMANFNEYTGVASIDGYDQFEASDYLYAMYVVGGEHAAGYGSGTNEERKKRLLARLDVLGLMGGRYIVSGVSLDDPSVYLMGTSSVSAFDIPLYVYEYKKARPRYYMATTTQAFPHASFEELVMKEKVFDEETFLDCVDCETHAKKLAKLELRKNQNGLYIFEAVTEEERFLVLSESFLPGWLVTIDGKVVAPIRSNGLYMAVRIPSGRHSVTFEYQGLFNELSVLKAFGIVR